jgi:hypothetical protein
LTPSIQGITGDTQLVDNCMSRSETDQNNGYSGRWSRGTDNNTDLTTIDTDKFNHGVAFNESLVNTLIANTGITLSLNKFSTLARNNNLFAYVRYNGKSELIQLIDRKGSSNGGERIIDFTPYAFYKVTNQKPISRQSVPYKTWTERTVSGVPNVGSMYVKICVGSKSQVLAAINSPSTNIDSSSQPLNTVKKIDLPALPNTAEAGTGQPDSILFPNTN